MVMWLFVIVSFFAQALACEDPKELVVELEQSVSELELDAAQKALKRMEASFSCSAFVEPSLLARMWLAEGLMLYINGDVEGTELSFAAARGAAPEVWDSNYGDDLRAIYDGSSVGEASGELNVKAVGYLVNLDGVVVEMPASIRPGLHLVQVGAESSGAQFSQIIYVNPGDAITLDPKLPERSSIADSAEASDAVASEAADSSGTSGSSEVSESTAASTESVSSPAAAEASVAAVTPAEREAPDPSSSRTVKSEGGVARSKKSRPLLITGSVALGTGLGLAGLALAQNGVLNPAIADFNDGRAIDAEEVRAAITRQQVFGTAAYALMGVGSVGLVIHFVPKGK